MLSNNQYTLSIFAASRQHSPNMITNTFPIPTPSPHQHPVPGGEGVRMNLGVVITPDGHPVPGGGGG